MTNPAKKSRKQSKGKPDEQSPAANSNTPAQQTIASDTPESPRQPTATIEDKANEVDALVADPDVLAYFRKVCTCFRELLQNPKHASDARSILDLPPRFRLRTYEQWREAHDQPWHGLSPEEQEERIERAKLYFADQTTLFFFSSVNDREIVILGAFVLLTILRDRQLEGPCMIRIAEDWPVRDTDITRTWGSMRNNWAAWRGVVEGALCIVKRQLTNLRLLPKPADDKRKATSNRGEAEGTVAVPATSTPQVNEPLSVAMSKKQIMAIIGLDKRCGFETWAKGKLKPLNRQSYQVRLNLCAPNERAKFP